MSKKLISALAAAILGATALSTPVMAETTATAGFLTDYIFRGNPLGEGSANGSIDYAHDSGFSAGVWVVDDGFAGTGMEFDVYASYGMDMDGWSWSVGATSYQYTYSTVSENEINLGASFGDFSIGADLGNQEDSAVSTVDNDFQHIHVSYAVNDVYSVLLANMDPNTDADDDGWMYLEISAAGQISDVDVSITLGAVDEEDLAGNRNGYLTLSASKTFDSLGF